MSWSRIKLVGLDLQLVPAPALVPGPQLVVLLLSGLAVLVRLVPSDRGLVGSWGAPLSGTRSCTARNILVHGARPAARVMPNGNLSGELKDGAIVRPACLLNKPFVLSINVFSQSSSVKLATSCNETLTCQMLLLCSADVGLFARMLPVGRPTASWLLESLCGLWKTALGVLCHLSGLPGAAPC